MKIFYSWSGNISKDIASEFKEFIQYIDHNIESFYSPSDLYGHWLPKLLDNLEDNNRGFIFVTQENFEAPWLNYETGCLAKGYKDSLVFPLLIDITYSELKQKSSPFSELQCIDIYDEGAVKLMLKKINSSRSEADRLPDELLDGSFGRHYPLFITKIGEISSNNISQKKKVLKF